MKFTTDKLGLYHNFTDRITPTGFAYVAFGSIRVSQLLTLAPPRSSVVFDPKLGDWDAKLRHEDVELDGKTIHVFFC